MWCHPSYQLVKFALEYLLFWLADSVDLLFRCFCFKQTDKKKWWAKQKYSALIKLDPAKCMHECWKKERTIQFGKQKWTKRKMMLFILIKANSNMLVHWCSFNIYICNGIPLSETYLIIYLYMEQVLNAIQTVTSCLAKCDIPERKIHKDLRMSSTFGRI